MSRIPIRLRLTVVFAAATLIVLAGAGAFVYVRLDDDLNESLDATLRARADAAATAATAGALPVSDPEDELAQVVDRDGRVIAHTGLARGPALRPAELRRARRSEVFVDRELPAIDGTARVLARPADNNGRVVVVGQSREDQDETLGGLVTSFALGGPIAVLLASLIGYGLATAGLRPVEAMRRRAAAVSLDDGDDARLPLPDADDEVHRLGQTLNDMLARLRASFERERRFVADASHELRTPIAVVKAEIEAALRHDDIGNDARRGLAAALEECDRLAQLAEDLLVLARAAEGEVPVRRERLDARTELTAARDRFADRAAARGRSIHVDTADGTTVDADPLRLRQAVGNMVDNALRHGGGDIRLSATTDPDGVTIDVSDDGPGFAPGLDGRAFERFTRGDETRPRGGAGLGLAIVRAIAQAHGGDAQVVPGTPTTVRLRLPVRPGRSHR